MRIVVTSLLAFSLASQATVDFTAADKDFAERANSKEGKEHIEAARKAYTAILKDPKSTSADKLRAMEHLGRLAYYQGDLLTSKDDHGTRVDIFRQCVTDTDAIADIEVASTQDPTQKTKTPEYYYWRATCLALQARSSGAFSKLGLVGPLKTALKEGLALGDKYEDGGIDRVAAAVYINSSGRIFGLYHPDEALKLIKAAVKLGPQHYNAYLIEADVLRELGRKEEADAVLRNALMKLEALKEDQYPAGRKPETKEFLRLLKAVAPKNAEPIKAVEEAKPVEVKPDETKAVEPAKPAAPTDKKKAPVANTPAEQVN